MPGPTATFVRIAALLGAASAGAIAGEPKVEVSLSTPHPSYLLGEPVPLVVAVENVGTCDLKANMAYIDPIEPNVSAEPKTEIYISRGGSEFQRFEFGLGPHGTRVPRLETLKPGEEWTHTLRVLYSRQDHGTLAFAEPGVYAVKVVQPLILGGMPPRKTFESNVIRVRIEEPEGVDARVWQRIRDSQALDFVQNGRWSREREATIMELVEALRAFPKSRYRRIYRDALMELYKNSNPRRAVSPRLSPANWEKVRILLGIPDPDAGPGRIVRLTTPQECYLVGEPVPLNVTVRNVSGQAIRAYEVYARDLETQGVFVTRGDGPFKQLFLRDGVGYSPRRLETLEPGETWTYRLRVLYSPLDPNAALTPEEATRIQPGGLAFGSPGTYRVRVAFPLRLEGVRQTESVESNEVAIRIREPEGTDAQVWRRIRDGEILHFLQTGEVPEGRGDIALKVVDALETFPNTDYRHALRHVLRRLFGGGPHLSEEGWERIRKLLDLPAPGDAFYDFYPGDERLDTDVTLNFPAGALVAEVLDSLSRQSQVRLDATPLAARGTFRGPTGSADLRSVMQNIAQAVGGRWFRGAEGYTLWSFEDLKRDIPEEDHDNIIL